jgi:hypothetical protein
MKSPPHGYKNDLCHARTTISNNFVKNTMRMRILMRVEGKIFQIRSESCQHGQIPRWVRVMCPALQQWRSYLFTVCLLSVHYYVLFQ